MLTLPHVLNEQPSGSVAAALGQPPKPLAAQSWGELAILVLPICFTQLCQLHTRLKHHSRTPCMCLGCTQHQHLPVYHSPSAAAAVVPAPGDVSSCFKSQGTSGGFAAIRASQTATAWASLAGVARHNKQPCRLVLREPSVPGVTSSLAIACSVPAGRSSVWLSARGPSGQALVAY